MTLDTASSPTSDRRSILFQTEPVVQQSSPPVIVIGLPRSGSTYLAHVLSCMKGLYIFDDLYPYQSARALGLRGPLTHEQQKAFLNKLSWPARIKVRFKKNIYAFAPQCTWEEIDQLEAAVLKTFEDFEVTWPALLEEWMMRLTLYHGCQRWGYKTPQDFMHLQELSDIFPGAQFVFVMRDIRKVMRSFKNLPKDRSKKNAPDGVVGQYHPIAYANYWKMAYQRTEAFATRRPDVPMYFVKFETLISEPEQEAARLADFFQTQVQKSVRVDRVNTSFTSDTRRELTATERWIAEKMAGDMMERHGYALEHAQPRLGDLFDLLQTSRRFAVYQIRRLLTHDRARQSILSYVKNILKR